MNVTSWAFPVMIACAIALTAGYFFGRRKNVLLMKQYASALEGALKPVYLGGRIHRLQGGLQGEERAGEEGEGHAAPPAPDELPVLPHRSADDETRQALRRRRGRQEPRRGSTPHQEGPLPRLSAPCGAGTVGSPTSSSRLSRRVKGPGLIWTWAESAV